MPGDTQGNFELVQTRIRVEGNSGELTFTNLIINQTLADTGSFSFVWRRDERGISISGHVDFYKKNLSKEVTINVQENFTFKGIIQSISCTRQDEMGTDYQIIGKGVFVKLDEVLECNSFYKKTFKQIFEQLNKAQGTALKLSPKNTGELFYTVQYNQTTFGFFKMLASRYGEWLYYNGTELVLGEIDSRTETLRIGVDVNDVNIYARMRKTAVPGVGFDHYSGDVLENTPQMTEGSGLIAASTQAGNAAFGSDHTSTHFSNAANNETLTSLNTLQQKATAASTVQMEGFTRNSKLKLAGKIKLTGANNSSEGEYIVTQLHHSCISNTNYQNHFIAIPAEAEVPPYTDPLLFPVCKAQPAKVVSNEDKDGLDRIKVRFPWMQQSESTPWIPVITPHAGKDRGFRFLPEVGEEVQIDFTDQNAERPYMIGSLFTDQNKSGTAHEGNHVKVIGSRTGRRLEINDDTGHMKLYDNFTDKTPKNGILFRRSSDDTKLMVESQKDADNYSVIVFDNGEALNMGLVSGGDLILEMRMEKDGKKITIHSKGSIELSADDNINLNASNINITASQELKLAGDGKGISLKGLKVEADAQTDLSLKGMNATVEGSAKLDLKGGAMASLTAALVKIN